MSKRLRKDQVRILRAAAARKNPAAFFVPNGKQEQILRLLGGRHCDHRGRPWELTLDWKGDPYDSIPPPPDGEYYRSVAVKAGNGIGKTTAMAMALNLIIFGKDTAGKNPFFKDCPFFLDWPFPRHIMVLSEPKAFVTAGQIYQEFMRWMPEWAKNNTRFMDRKKGSQKFYSEWVFEEHDFVMEWFSTEQEVTASAGRTVGLVATDEPLKEAFRGETRARLRSGGMFLNMATYLAGNSWLLDVQEDMQKEGKKTWIFIEGHIRDNTVEQGVRGRLKLSDVEDAEKEWAREGTDVLAARAAGDPLGIGGVVYKKYAGQRVSWDRIQVNHDLCRYDELSPTIYHIVDPHNTRPWAMIWIAVYKVDALMGVGRLDEKDWSAASGEDLWVVFQEWPTLGMTPFHQWANSEIGYSSYVKIIRDMETGLMIRARIMDERYGWQKGMTSGGTESISKAIHRESVRAVREGEVKNPLIFVKSRGKQANQIRIIQDRIGYQEVKDGSTRPPLLLLENEIYNLDYALRRYKWKENRGKSLDTSEKYQDKPEQKYQCFPRLIEYAAGHGLRWYHPDVWMIEGYESGPFEDRPFSLDRDAKEVVITKTGTESHGGWDNNE